MLLVFFFFPFFQIEADVADYAWAAFSCTYARAKVSLCSFPIDFSPVHYLSRYPPAFSPIWNLTRLCPITVWYWVFGSIVTVVCFFIIASMVYQKMAKKTRQEEIILFPFRYLISVPN